MQLPSSDHTDQFHGNPNIDNRALSMASSRLDNRDKNSAFLQQVRAKNQNLEHVQE